MSRCADTPSNINAIGNTKVGPSLQLRFGVELMAGLRPYTSSITHTKAQQYNTQRALLPNLQHVKRQACGHLLLEVCSHRDHQPFDCRTKSGPYDGDGIGLGNCMKTLLLFCGELSREENAVELRLCVEGK